MFALSSRFRVCVMLGVSSAALALIVWACQPPANAEEDDDAPIAAPAGPQAQLLADIDDAIAQLEKGHVEAFIDRYMPAEELRRLRQTGRKNLILENIKKSNGQYEKVWLARLKALRKGKIEFLDADKSLAKVVGDPNSGFATSNFFLVDPADEKIPNYQGFSGDLQQAAGKAVVALEQRDYPSFVENFYPPSELKAATSKEGMQALETRLKACPEMAQQMIADLKAIQKMEPKYDDQKTAATFEIPVGQSKTKTRTVRFEIAGTWRMADTGKQIRREMYKQSQQPPQGAQEELTTRWERIRDHWRLYDDK